MITRYGLPTVAVVAAAFALIQMSLAQQKAPPSAPPVEPARAPFQHPLAGAGIVEPETENIAVGSHVPGVVDEVLVRVGEPVRPGQPLFRLDDRHLQAELRYRQAAVAAAEANLHKLREAPRPEEVPPLAAKVEEAQANLKNQEQLLARMERVTESGAGAQEDLASRRMAVAVARAQVTKAQKDLELLQKGAWGPDRLIAEAAVRQAEAQASQTRTELDRLVVKAPRSGRPGGTAGAGEAGFEVLQVNVRPGEFVGTVAGTPLVVLGQVGRPHVRVDIDENEIARFRPGLAGVAKPRGNPGEEFRLTFVRVEPYVIPKKSLTGSNTERVDTRVLQVIYAVETRGRPLFVGQQMDVFLDTGAKE